MALQRTPRPKPKSFGVYLGPLASTVTADEARVLSQWDLVVLDPRQPGVLDTVATSPCSADHVVARLDLAALLPELKPTDGPAAVLRGLDKVTTTAFEWQKRSQGLGSGFTSVLVAGWDTAFTVSVCNEVLDFLAGLGFDVYLELADPNFLGDDRTLRLDLLSGMVIRNGSILPGGERRDYFGMAQMRTTIQAMVGQACLRQFSTMVWDTVDDDVPLSYAIIRRTHSWCSFYGALLWAGRKSTLYDAATNVVPPRPLGAFDWLKDEAVMKLHDNWRFNPRVWYQRDTECWEKRDPPTLAGSAHLSFFISSSSCVKAFCGCRPPPPGSDADIPVGVRRSVESELCPRDDRITPTRCRCNLGSRPLSTRNPRTDRFDADGPARLCGRERPRATRSVVVLA